MSVDDRFLNELVARAWGGGLQLKGKDSLFQQLTVMKYPGQGETLFNSRDGHPATKMAGLEARKVLCLGHPLVYYCDNRPPEQPHLLSPEDVSHAT